MSPVSGSSTSIDGSPAHTPLPQEARKARAGLIVGGAVMALAAAILLWMRFGPSTFVDALNAVWTCL